MSNITEQTLDLIKQAQGYGNNTELQKSITTANNLSAYDLQAPAKNLYPVQTPIRNTLPRTSGIGTATNWRVVRNIIGSGFDAMGWVPEGQRTTNMSYTTQSLSASFKTLGEEDRASYEAINAGRGFEDIRARMTMRLLQKLMLKEESAIIGGNTSVALNGVYDTGTSSFSIPTPIPTLSASGSGATLTASANYYVKVVALTYEGYRNSTVGSGVAIAQLITGSDGASYVLYGGSSAISAASAAQAVTLGQTLFMSCTPVNGAVAYAWFIGTSNGVGGTKLQAITTINSYARSTPLLTTTQADNASVNVGAPTPRSLDNDNSANGLAFDGLLYNAFNPSSGAYIKSLATGTAGTGSGLTSSGRGSIVEIDDMLISMWNNNQLSPTVIYCNAQEIRSISNKVLGNASAPLVRYNVGENASSMQLAASPFVDTYFNPITKQPLRIEVHPNVPPGTILSWADDLPAQYQSSEVPNVAEIRARQDYYQIDWPVTSRNQAVGVYCEEVLVCYAPFAIGVINNIANA
jgi:hypothetical protein